MKTGINVLGGIFTKFFCQILIKVGERIISENLFPVLLGKIPEIDNRPGPNKDFLCGKFFQKLIIDP